MVLRELKEEIPLSLVSLFVVLLKLLLTLLIFIDTMINRCGTGREGGRKVWLVSSVVVLLRERKVRLAKCIRWIESLQGCQGMSLFQLLAQAS